MEPSDALSAIAQLGLGLAGFTGIVVAFGRRPGRLAPVEAYRLAVLLSLSLGAMALALIPLVLRYLGLTEPLVWRAASGLFVALTALFFLAFTPRTLRFFRENPEIFQLPILFSLATFHALNGIAQATNALGLWGDAAPGVYTVGLLWLVVHGSYQFARMLFYLPTPR